MLHQGLLKMRKSQDTSGESVLQSRRRNNEVLQLHYKFDIKEMKMQQMVNRISIGVFIKSK